MENSDEELIEQYLNGKKDVFRFLVERYSDSLFNFVVRFVGKDNAPDILQDVFLKVWKNLKNFDDKKASFKTWIFTIAKNTSFDFLKKRKTLVFSDLDDGANDFVENILDESDIATEIIQKLEDKELLNSILNKLPENYKTVLVLYYQEEMTFKEIGEILNKPLNTVKSYHHRAILKIKEEFAPNY